MGRNTKSVDATLARAAASNYWSETEAQAVLEAYEASGLSVAEFARRHGLGPQRLRWWKKRRAEEEGPALCTRPANDVLRDLKTDGSHARRQARAR